MKDESHILITMALQFTLLSVLAFGGANAVAPEIHRQTVGLHGWLSEREFADMFALSQAIPGPNVMVVTLIGYHVAGLAGAIVITIAMCGPTSILAHFFSGAWDKFKDAQWRKVLQAALVPISIGLVGLSGVILARAADHSWTAAGITAAAAVVVYFTKWHPLLLVVIAGALGVAKLV